MSSLKTATRWKAWLKRRESTLATSASLGIWPWRGIKFVHVIIHRPLKPKIFQPVATALKAAEVISPKSEDDWAKGWGLMHISPCHCAEDRGPWTAWV
ncbi:zinc knuckle domain-containing protein [Histoplasma capsulatum var. duboisii H88]|uniref:Zinc knuckle domain-containing protein n=1 Tax=Ajellomyces capsulatus (strain H88) TaxID=544711 RepID=F0UFX3_AJEC8|nr:zinc knuckle domain-containing protein [Histoplasma capsulatum var. duboisii H88]